MLMSNITIISQIVEAGLEMEQALIVIHMHREKSKLTTT